ncbi:hypothetical protein [Vallitalea guaymasensis]|uniref:hypothetical protein n=1 Tax=Vallitalea guaymasensis TaxID=1185412 RepID=UPI000DE2A379|nr:hypothetical protein [Vallitalea guaymasensis]
MMNSKVIKKLIQLRKEDGGIESIIDEISLTSLGLIILITIVLVIFAASISNIRTAVEKTTSQDKIVIQSSLETINATEVLGQDVISNIRYYASDSSVEVQVTSSKGTKSYINTTYDSDFHIGYEDTYTVEYKRDQDEEIIKCHYTIKN